MKKLVLEDKYGSNFGTLDIYSDSREIEINGISLSREYTMALAEFLNNWLSENK